MARSSCLPKLAIGFKRLSDRFGTVFVIANQVGPVIRHGLESTYALLIAYSQVIFVLAEVMIGSNVVQY